MTIFIFINVVVAGPERGLSQYDRPEAIGPTLSIASAAISDRGN